MARKQQTRPESPGAHSASTTKSYTTRIEKTKPKYSFRIETSTKTETAIREEIEFDWRTLFTAQGALRILEILIAIGCMIFFSPPLTWFTRVLCAIVAICFSVTIYIILQYLFTLYRVLMPKWPWLTIELIYTYSASLSYLISSIFHLVFTNTQEYKTPLLYHDYYNSYLIAGGFGIANFIIYAIHAQLLQNARKRQIERRPKVYIVNTTLDKRGKEVKKRVTQHNI